MLYDGPVRVPEGAAEKMAVLRVELESTTGKKAKTTDLPVKLLREPEREKEGSSGARR
jgi:hypothetical protein